MKEEIKKIILEIIPKDWNVEVEDTSFKHQHHGHGFRSESHFEVVIFTKTIVIMEKITIQKQATQALAHLYAKELVHSISISCK